MLLKTYSLAPTLVWHHIGNTVRQTVFIILLSMALGAAVNLIRPDSIPFVETWSMVDKLVTEDGETLAIPLEDAADLFADNAVVFLDARTPAEYGQGHIQGAVNLPWHEVDNYFETVIMTLDTEAMIITYCDGEACSLSHDLAMFLKDLGFTRVKVLVNAWTLWKEHDLPISTPSS
ncbi:MAG: rhodanese-like domain-containing protein [Desulfotignum sp.]|nr:rhodanese-like domain-containing protein [Desulfotignum sp.]MCF8086576.1 rhodanese-like domain-containing protein [Desulfotignum sp.]MCF8136182.1 rhodanese-like domain-containing protein [Desulfotignum sp.]